MCIVPNPILIRYAITFTVYFLLEFISVHFLRLDTLAPLLQHHFQIADLYNLQTTPFISLVYLHIQPPLFNALVAGFFALNGRVYDDLLVLNCLCNALVGITVMHIVNDYSRGRKWLGHGFALVYILAPSTLLYAAYPFYPALTSAGYALLALSFFTKKRHAVLSLVLLIVGIIYLTMLRSSFPPVIALAVIGIYFTLIENHSTWRQSALLVIVCSLAPITSIYTKNLILYDFWGSTSFSPLNMAKGFGIPVEPNHFPTPEQIKSDRPDLSCDHSYHAVDRDTVKKDGGPNYNSCYWLAFAQSHKNLAWNEYELKPHMLRIVSHIARYFSLSDRYQYLTNRTSLETYTNIYNAIFLPWSPREGYSIRISVVLLVLIMPWLLYRHRDNRLLALYAVFLIHMISHAVTDGDEGDRFVFDIEFSLYVFAAYASSLLFRKRSHL
jgi:hypothetical protein